MSGIALLCKPGVDASDLRALLVENGVYASVRNGAIRIATHYYNTNEEIERIISVMAS
jgi:selenocysteine lyase/cysteine desulfurase